MQIRKILVFLAFTAAVLFAFITWNVPFFDIFNMPSDIAVSESDIGNIESSEQFGPLVTTKYNAAEQTVDFMLLDTVKIRSVGANTNLPKQVYLGGNTIGFAYQGDGVMVVGKNAVKTKDGYVDTLKDNQLRLGDIICSINGEKIDCINKISQVINDTKVLGKEIEIRAMRKGTALNVKLKPAYDVLAKKYKLGLWVRDEMSGIGTVTFIDPSTRRFGALGHNVVDENTGESLAVKDGDVYKCGVFGVKRAERGMPGELRGVFMRSEKTQGSIDKNCNLGVYGYLNEDSKYLDNAELIDVGGRMSVKPGAAHIYCSIDGKTKKKYAIEIIKTNYQSASHEKNLVFKVVDPDLIKLTGGIVQGMSGSPIIQNGKLIGAVTHVFVNDPTKGFGVYIDWMLQE